MQDHPAPPQHTATAPSFRSGAVARMAGMPVATLRVWEQRYQAVKPNTQASGHRLYSSADVERVVLLRQLTEHGHAIGSLAALDTAALRRVAQTHTAAQTPAATAAMAGMTASGVGLPPLSAPLRTVVVGPALAQRLKRPGMPQRWGRLLRVVGVFDSLEDAAQAAAASTEAAPDLLLWQTPGLQVGALPALRAAQDAWRARAAAVAYRFAGAPARDALTQAGIGLTREPADDGALGRWLASLAADLAAAQAVTPTTTQAAHGNPGPASAHSLWALTEQAAPARRFDDASLTDFAALSPRIACECPSHLAELLMQIGSFERYSADCTHRNPADAALHAHLHRVAGAARALFEAALERVAVAEGWPLPVARPDA
jgi:hypothetical protein